MLPLRRPKLPGRCGLRFNKSDLSISILSLSTSHGCWSGVADEAMTSCRHVAAYHSSETWSASLKPDRRTFFDRLLDGHRHRHRHRQECQKECQIECQKERRSEERRVECRGQSLRRGGSLWEEGGHSYVSRGGRLWEDGCHRRLSRGGLLWEDSRHCHVSRGGRFWKDCHRQSFSVEGSMKNGGSGSGSVLDGDQPKKTVAIIGAGIAGLTCAAALAERGLSVTVFELARGPGGRMSQRREKWASEVGDVLLRFDHGAQYIDMEASSAHPEVIQLLDKWREAGILDQWEGRFGTVDARVSGTEFIPEMKKKVRLVGVPGMNSICQALSRQAGVQVKYGCYVGSFRRESEDEGSSGHWILNSTDGVDLGKYHALVISDKILSNERFTALTGLSPPLESAGVPDMKKKMESVLAQPCFALMLAFRQPLEQVPFDGAIVEGSDLISWMARDSSKPSRQMSFEELKGSTKKLDLECWVIHSTAEYAAKRIAAAPTSGKPSADLLASIGDELFHGFKAIIEADTPEPCFMKAHRWGGAFPTTAAAPEGGCLADSAMQIFACGDFCVGPRIDLAIRSALSAARVASASLQNTPRL